MKMAAIGLGLWAALDLGIALKQGWPYIFPSSKP
jgi:hypothetical protein